MKKIILLTVITILAAGCGTTVMQPCSDTDSIYNPDPNPQYTLWADSWLYAKAPELEVETWLSDVPDTKGKYVLIEFWGTYCPPCRRTLPVLNEWHRKYKDELVIIGISHEDVETVRNFKTHKLEFYSAVDSQARTKNLMNVTGVPHVIIIEPGGYIIWEGFPLLKGYELTEEKIQKILAVGRSQK